MERLTTLLAQTMSEIDLSTLKSTLGVKYNHFKRETHSTMDK